MNWKSIKQLIVEELEGELGKQAPAPSPQTDNSKLPSIVVGSNKLKLRLGVNKNETKLGSRDAEQSVIKGDDLVDFLNDMLTDINTAFNKAMTAITPGGVIITGGGAAIPIFATDIYTRTKNFKN